MPKCNSKLNIHAKGLCEKCYKKDFYHKNKLRLCEYHRRYRKLHPEIMSKIGRRNNIKQMYGITMKDYELMLNTQNGRCIICERDFMENKTKICIDHNHVTGKVRGLLCNSCNIFIGFLEGKELLYNKAKEYLNGGIK